MRSLAAAAGDVALPEPAEVRGLITQAVRQIASIADQREVQVIGGKALSGISRTKAM